MSAEKLIARMRQAREVKAPALGHDFTVRIPTDGEMEDFAESLGGKKLTFRRIVARFTVGWDFKELDLISGGGPEPVPFDADLFAEWMGANIDAVQPLFDHISQGMQQRKADLDGAEKN